MERYVDNFVDGSPSKRPLGVEIANTEEIREGRVPLRFGTQEYLDRIRSNSEGRFEDQKTLSREKDLSLVYVKRALGVITPQLLGELSQYEQVTDRERRLCFHSR